MVKERITLYHIDDPAIIKTRNSIFMKEFLENLGVDFNYLPGKGLKEPLIRVDMGRYIFVYDNIEENPDYIKTIILDTLNPNSEDWVV